MTTATLLIAYSRPWHFWIGAALLAVALMLVAGLAIRYYRTILVPFYSWMFNEEDDRPFAPGAVNGPRRVLRNPTGGQ